MHGDEGGQPEACYSYLLLEHRLQYCISISDRRGTIHAE